MCRMKRQDRYVKFVGVYESRGIVQVSMKGREIASGVDRERKTYVSVVIPAAAAGRLTSFSVLKDEEGVSLVSAMITGHAAPTSSQQQPAARVRASETAASQRSTDHRAAHRQTASQSQRASQWVSQGAPPTLHSQAASAQPTRRPFPHSTPRVQDSPPENWWDQKPPHSTVEMLSPGSPVGVNKPSSGDRCS